MSINVIDAFKFDPTGKTDNAGRFASFTASLSDLNPLPRFVFPEGVYSYSNCPNLALENLEIFGEGQCEWHYTGVNDALTIDGNSTGPTQGVMNMIVDGIRVVPTAAARTRGLGRCARRPPARCPASSRPRSARTCATRCASRSRTAW